MLHQRDTHSQRTQDTVDHCTSQLTLLAIYHIPRLRVPALVHLKFFNHCRRQLFNYILSHLKVITPSFWLSSGMLVLLGSVLAEFASARNFTHGSGAALIQIPIQFYQTT